MMLKTQHVNYVMVFLVLLSFKLESPAQHARILIPMPNGQRKRGMN
jgi:hypothetical protein